MIKQTSITEERHGCHYKEINWTVTPYRKSLIFSKFKSMKWVQERACSFIWSSFVFDYAKAACKIILNKVIKYFTNLFWLRLLSFGLTYFLPLSLSLSLFFWVCVCVRFAYLIKNRAFSMVKKVFFTRS